MWLYIIIIWIGSKINKCFVSGKIHKRYRPINEIIFQYTSMYIFYVNANKQRSYFTNHYN